MWPFSKKQKQPEAKTDEEKIKQNIAARLVFDPVTMQLKIKPKEPKPPPEVKLECPTCKQALVKYSESRFKCPHCRNWIYFRDYRLVTKEEYAVLREEYNRRRQEEWQRESQAEDLTKLGLTEAMYQQREQELSKTTGVAPKRPAVLLSLFNENIMKVRDLNEREERYNRLAIILNRAGEESFHILKAAAKTGLAALKKEGFVNVSIMTNETCEACNKVNGKVLSIEEALRTMPIPIKECANYPYNETRSFCTCWYSSEYDDAYMDKQ